MSTITLPWPPRQLSPNTRTHWAKKSKAAKEYKLACWYAAQESGVRADWDGPILLDIVFHKPSRRPMDLDNMLAAIKSGLDGVALALNANDVRFMLRLSVADQIGGMVKIRVERPA